jgi:hypothetical protein
MWNGKYVAALLPVSNIVGFWQNSEVLNLRWQLWPKKFSLW